MDPLHRSLPYAAAAGAFARHPVRTTLVWLWHELRVGLVVCAIAALFISTMFGDPLVGTLVYSLCIGLSIQFLIEAGRYGLSYRLRQRDPQDPAARSNWPGWAWMAPWSVVAAVAGYYMGSLIGDWLTGAQRTHNLLGSNLRALSLVLMVSLAITISAVYFFYSRGRLATMQALAEHAERNAAETQLRLLQSQLEPHMLFNTLANLRVLIALDPQRAQAMLDHLIAFLRSTLNASRAGMHPLAAELEHIGDYLALMQVRMGERLQVSIELPPDLAALPVPPLLLQPLVENAVKHGLEPKLGGGRIELVARVHAGMLELRVRDTGVGLAASPSSTPDGTRFGLQQVRERIAGLYGGRASLQLMDATGHDGGAEAVLRLPMPDAPSASPTSS